MNRISAIQSDTPTAREFPIRELARIPKGAPLLKRVTEYCKRWWQVVIEDGLIWRAREAKFFELMGGHIFFQALSAGVEFDIFNLIARSERMSEEQIAFALKLDQQACRILLLTLTTAKLVRRSRQGAYSLTSIAKRYLLSDSTWKYSDCVRWQNHINYRAMGHFKDALVQNTNSGLSEIAGDEPTLYQRLVHQPHLEKIFQSAMQEISAQGNQSLTTSLEFENVQNLVDVGGGNATNIIAIAKKYPHIHARVFDFPSVCDIASENIAKHGLQDRLGAVPGNIFQDALPTGADCVIFCHFFTIWSKEERVALLRKAYEVLPIGGRAMIFNMMQWDNRTGPHTAAIGSPYFLTLATGRGMLYCWNEYENDFKEVGFKRITRTRLPRDHGLIVGIK